MSIRMDKFVKGENDMWKMPAKERIQTRIGAEKRVLDSRFAPPPPPLTWRCSGKKKHPYYYVAIILNYRNVAKHLWREPQIITFENAFHIWINIGYICERTLSAVSRVKSRFRARLTDCNLQSQLQCAVTPFEQNYSKLLSSRQRQMFY